MPKTLVSGKNETICLMLHQAKLPAKILIDLKWKEQHHTTLRSLDSGNIFCDYYCILLDLII